MLPTTMLQKMAGFSREAQRMYMPGWLQKDTGAIVAVSAREKAALGL